MLENIHISNYALIDKVDIQFYPGLNIITGETGAGKSIMLGALSLLLGGRADAKAIRHSNVKSVIECTFRVEGYTALEAYCQENDIEWQPDICIMRREISPNGRSRAFINDTPVNLAQLQGVGMQLVDIHSQHQNQLLAQPHFQRDIIDCLADNGERLRQYTGLYNSFRTAMRAFKAAKAAIARDSDNADFMQFQLNQIDELNIAPGELSELERDRDALASQTDTKANLCEALDALSEGRANILSLLTTVQDCCSEIESSLDPDDRIPSRLAETATELGDIADTLSAINAGIAADSSDLDEIESRISGIYSMMRKHHADTPEQLLEIADDLRTRLARIEDADVVLADLEKEARTTRRKAMEAAKEISMARTKAAAEFADRLMTTATPLGMKNLVCDIEITPADMSATGIDNVEFKFAFNKNQTPIPVSGAASGGEISRLMLSIKSIVGHRMMLPSIIFDEVDTGVSGDVAARMGRMMLDTSADIQVIAITHLPQVAALGQHHFKVFKEDDEDTTHTRILELDRDRRVDELALMLSGDPNNTAARTTAIDLLSR